MLRSMERYLPGLTSLPEVLQWCAHCYRKQTPNSHLPYQSPYQNRLWHHFHLLLILICLLYFSGALLSLLLFNSNQERTGYFHVCWTIQSHNTSPWFLSPYLAYHRHPNICWISEWTVLLGKQRMPYLKGDQACFCFFKRNFNGFLNFHK